MRQLLDIIGMLAAFVFLFCLMHFIEEGTNTDLSFVDNLKENETVLKSAAFFLFMAAFLLFCDIDRTHKPPKNI